MFLKSVTIKSVMLEGQCFSCLGDSLKADSLERQPCYQLPPLKVSGQHLD